MHLQTVIFQRVFGVRRYLLKHGRMTEFGFVADGQTHFEARVYGWPEFEAGDKVTAIMRVPGKWTSMQGWLNHASGEVVYPNYRRTWPYLIAALLLLPVSLYLGLSPDSAHLGTYGRVLMLTFSGVFLIFLANACHLMLRALKVRRTLEALRAHQRA